VTHVVLPTPPTPGADGTLSEIDEAIRNGGVFISVGHAREAGAFRFAAVNPAGPITPMGGTTAFEPGLRLATTVVEPAGGPLLIRVIRDGKQIGYYRGNALDWPADEPGVYRIEIYRYGWHLGDMYYNLRPWIFANPVRLETRPAAAQSPSLN
jgi:hypothetical protein